MSGWGVRCQSGCEQRIEVFVKIPKKKFFFFFWGGGGGRWGGGGSGEGSGWMWEGSGLGGGGQGGCERRIEVFVKIQKKQFFWGGVGGGGQGRVWGSEWM